MADRNVRIVVEAITKGQANLKSFSAGLDSIGTQARKLGDAFKTGFSNQVSSQLGGIGDAISALPGPLGLVAGGAALAGTALVKMALDTTAAAIAFDKLSKKTGSGVEFLSGFTEAAKDMDVNAESVSAGLTRFADVLATVDGPAANVEARLLELADTFAQMEDGPAKTALAINAFGRQAGPDLVPLLNQGRDGVLGLIESMRDMGRVITQDTVDAANRFDDAIDGLSGRLAGLRNTIGGDLLPIFTDLAAGMDSGLRGFALFKRGLDEINTIGTPTASTLSQLQLSVIELQLAASYFNPAGALMREELERMRTAAEESVGKFAALKNGFDLATISAEYHALSQKKMSDASSLSAAEADKLAKYQLILNKAVEEGEPAAVALARSLLGIPPAANAAGIAALLSGKDATLAAGYWRDAAGVIINAAAQIAGARYAGMAKQAFIDQNNAQAKLIPTQDKLKQKGKDLTAGYRAMYDQIQSNVSANERYGRSWDDLTKKISGGGGAVKQIDEQLKALEDRARTVQGALGGGSAEFSKNEKLQTAYAIATGELSAEQFQLQQAIKAVVAANEAGALSTDQALAAALSASQGLVEVQELFAIAGDAGKPFAAASAEIVGAVASATAKVDELKTRLGELPKNPTVKLEAKVLGLDIVGQLRQQMEYLIANARTSVIIDVIYRQTGAPPPPENPPGAALGGNVFGWTWVGERGPELVYFGQPAHVFSNTQSKNIASGGGDGGAGVSVVVNVAEVNNGADINSLAWRVADEIQKRRRA